MGTRLKTILQFPLVPSGGTQSKPHRLNWNGLPVTPDVLALSTEGFTAAADELSVTVTNTGPDPMSIAVLCSRWHTIDRDFGDEETLDLVPQPFIIAPGGGGGAAFVMVEDEGALVAVRPALNFIGGAVVAVDDPPFNRANIIISAAAVTNNPPTQIDVGDAGLVGVSPDAARADHQHALPAPPTPVAVVGSLNSPGASASPARADHLHRLELLVDDEGLSVTPGRPGLNFEGAGVFAADNAGADRVDVVVTAANVTPAEVPTPIDVGDAGIVGVSADAAHADHQHALAAPGAPRDVDKSPAAAGASSKVAREDHKHDVATAPPVTVVGQVNLEGISASLSRADHLHRLELVVGDEGLFAGARPAINFIGAGVTAVDNAGADRVDVTIPGSDATAVLGFGDGNIGSQIDTRFLDPWFGGRTEIAATTVVEIVAPRAGTIRNFYVRHNAAIGNGNSVVYTVTVNGVATAITATLATGAAGTAADLVHSVVVAAGDRIGVTAAKAASIGNGAIVVETTMELAA